MQRCGLDGIIASSPVNITYFTGYHCWLDGQFKEFMVKPGGSGDLLPAFALYRPAGRPGLTVSALLAVNALDLAVDLCPWGDAALEWGAPLGPMDEAQQRLWQQLRAMRSEDDGSGCLSASGAASGVGRGAVGPRDGGLARTSVGRSASGFAQSRTSRLLQRDPPNPHGQKPR